MESVLNRNTKKICPSASSTEEAMEASQHVERHLGLLEQWREMCGTKDTQPEGTKPRAAKFSEKNVLRLRAFIRTTIITAENKQEHALPRVTTHLGKAPTQISMSSTTYREMGVERCRQYLRQHALHTSQGGSEEGAQYTLTQPRYTKVKLYGKTQARTCAQLHRANADLQRALALRADIKVTDIGKPFQFTSFHPDEMVERLRYQPQSCTDKGAYRRILSEVLADIREKFCGERQRASQRVTNPSTGSEAYRAQDTNVVHYPRRGEDDAPLEDLIVRTSVLIVDYMFSIRLQQSAPAMYRWVPLRTGAQFVAWVLDRTVLPLVREGSGYACADIHADVCAPLAKKGTERQRDASRAPQQSGTNCRPKLELTRAGNVPSRRLLDYVNDRDTGRRELFELMAELVRDDAFWSQHMRLRPARGCDGS